MGFERDEVPSRVKGSALVGLGKAQKPCMQFFSRRLKRARPTPQGARQNGFRKGRSPFAGAGQRPAGSRAAPLRTPGEAPKPTRAFRRRRKSSAKPPKKREKPQVAIPDKGKVTCGFLACVTRLLFRSAAMQGIDSLEKVDWEENDEDSTPVAPPPQRVFGTFEAFPSSPGIIA